MSPLERFWYDALVRLFPSDFRAGFGEEVKAVILEQRANLSPASRPRRLRFHIAATLDLLRAALLQWRPALLRVASGIVLIAALANLGYDLANPKLTMGVIAWAMTVSSIGWSLRTLAGAERRRRPG